ncbi:uncharacterized protein F5147DRAFT_746669 [Suillus discolor]|uniref:CxC2-like cysteine cluster KDZ transposase-associated domain-containing protein n=1 Tax=Suillus discolor TaxID=1912936 RepID=A0A9P7F390_9AGAM|nr:uncharacterized protein F5147DRAFT_746669 [Suillus discolor]KAG2103729.1 hypothetical protein F5147DRAFT_746669 [Suillus discolor]
MICLEGRVSMRLCLECDGPNPEYKCQDCFGSELHCSTCILSKWNALGLRIQLGHITGRQCVNPHRAFNDDFVIIDIFSIHEVSLDFCGCAIAKSCMQQLLRMSLFPSTTSDPKTAATFHSSFGACHRVLEQYHLLSFESKISAYEFYHGLRRMSDNTGLLLIKDRYESFMWMIRKWRHLKMLKRSGRGHDPKGVEATAQGECAVLCPACPHPGKNLPDNWKYAPRRISWLYGLFLAIDANFRLKCKAVLNDSVDPSLSSGWAYFVEDEAYKGFLDSNSDNTQEKSTCSSHNAVNMADTKSNCGLAATGLGTVNCARHNMKRPNAVGDLQKGKRYVNMDYLFFSTLRHTVIDTLNVSYDIVCQWHKKLWHHMSTFPFHLPAHIEECQTSFSFNFKSGVGRTDGEAPERGWANINPVASSTKEMGPGARRDTLDDYFGDSNWKKVVKLGHTMLHKMKDALPERQDHHEALDDLEEGLRGEYSASLTQWREQVEAWERDPAKPNPFKRRAEIVTMASARLELARDDQNDIQTGTCLALHKDCTPSVLISTGLELEEQQASLRVHATDNQEGKMLQQNNTLQCRIDTWTKLQELYMPSLAALRVSESSVSGGIATAVATPETVKLWLPSQMGKTAPCDTRLQTIEWKLRYVQAHDALRSLRSNLCAQTAILKYKDRNLRGQGANTRARNTLKAVEARLEAAASTYERAHKALVVLAPLLNQTGWHSSLRPLNQADIRSMTDLLWGESEGTRKLSWIWNMARAMRWAEEVELLKDEMWRILQFFVWDAQCWDERGLEDALHDVHDDDEREGLIAYAKRQASLCRRLAESFRTSWTDTLALADIFNHSLITQQDMDID